MTRHPALPVSSAVHERATELEQVLRSAIGEDVRFDTHTRTMYATDASIYAIEPVGVVYPRDGDDVVAAVEIARRFGVPVLPRGAGTSLAGQTVGAALILDFSRHMNRIIEVDAERSIARVQPGVVQDDLNRAAGRHDLWFAPDTSTANRATLGGMIGNNSCGSRSARYGMTIDHVSAIDVVLADAYRATLGVVDAVAVRSRVRGDTIEANLYREIPRLIAANADAIATGFPPHWRRSGGYRLDRMLDLVRQGVADGQPADIAGGPDPVPDGFSLAPLVIGSEGTLAITLEATLRLVPRPRAVSALAGHFNTLRAALDAVEDARDCNAAAIELIDDLILSLARRSPLHRHLAASLEGQPAALLWVEFYGDSQAEADAAADALAFRWSGGSGSYAVARARTTAELRLYRELRKAGLGLLTAAGTGRERSIAFVEDTAVDPSRLGEYTDRFSDILDEHGLRAGFYGHASAGCLHIRPFMDLSQPGEPARMRSVAERVLELVVEFGGMNSSEHGDGMVRAEFSRRLFGDRLYEAMRSVKALFDPDNLLNPGKKVDSPRMTDNLRDAARPVAVDLTTHFDFGPTGMHGAADRCARVGACRKVADSGGTMCPSFMATRDEEHSTRGRANALAMALSAPDPRAALGDRRLFEVLDLCLECKACRRECPMSVDMAALKSEFLSQHQRIHGVPLRSRLFGAIRSINRIGAALAPFANRVAAGPTVRALAERITGIDRRRPLPRFSQETLQKWFTARPQPPAGTRGDILFLADCFTSYTEPGIGRAAIELLELAGWTVQLVDGVCCGRASISKGLLDRARAQHDRLLAAVGPAAAAGTPIVGCEPSCVLTLRDEVPALAGDRPLADAVASQARLVDDLLCEALDDGSLEIEGDRAGGPADILFHAHCHQKAAGETSGSVKLLQKLAGNVIELDSGCCGMAGSFGFEREHYDLSMRIGSQRLFPAIRERPGLAVAATGVSCRQQIEHGTARTAVHPVTLLRDRVRPGGVSPP